MSIYMINVATQIITSYCRMRLNIIVGHAGHILGHAAFVGIGAY